MLERILFWVAVIVVVIVVYHWLDKDTTYERVQAVRGTGEDIAIHSRNILHTSVKAAKTVKAQYKAEAKEHEAAFAKSGKSWREERVKRQRDKIKTINSYYEPTNKALDTAKAEADKRHADANAALTLLENA